MVAPPPSPPAGRPAPRALRAAAAVVTVETLAETAAVAARHELTPGLRGLLVLCLSLKWLCAWRVVHLSAGAALGLLLLEGTTVVAALGAVDSPGGARLALGGTAVAVMVLVARSLHAFPDPAPPPGWSRPPEVP